LHFLNCLDIKKLYFWTQKTQKRKKKKKKKKKTWQTGAEPGVPDFSGWTNISLKTHRKESFVFRETFVMNPIPKEARTTNVLIKIH
jgi:hypothetical protein